MRKTSPNERARFLVFKLYLPTPLFNQWFTNIKILLYINFIRFFFLIDDNRCRFVLIWNKFVWLRCRRKKCKVCFDNNAGSREIYRTPVTAVLVLLQIPEHVSNFGFFQQNIKPTHEIDSRCVYRPSFIFSDMTYIFSRDDPNVKVVPSVQRILN